MSDFPSPFRDSFTFLRLILVMHYQADLIEILLMTLPCDDMFYELDIERGELGSPMLK